MLLLADDDVCFMLWIYYRTSVVLKFLSFSSTAKTAPLSVPALQVATRSSALPKTDGTVRACVCACVCARERLKICQWTNVKDWYLEGGLKFSMDLEIPQRPSGYAAK